MEHGRFLGLYAMSCHEWYKCFKLGRIFDNDLKSGTSSISMNDDLIEKMYAVIYENCHWSVCIVSECVTHMKSDGRCAQDRLFL